MLVILFQVTFGGIYLTVFNESTELDFETNITIKEIYDLKILYESFLLRLSIEEYF